MKWLARAFASAVVRRVAVLAVAALLAWAGLGIDKAHAGQYGCSGAPSQPCDQGQAYQACMNHAARMAGSWGGGTTAMCTHNPSFKQYLTCQAPEGSNCASGSAYWYYYQTGCSARPALTGGWTRVGASGGTCSDGCAFGGGASGQSITVNGRTYMSKDGATPTGSVCGTGDEAGTPVTTDDCQTVAGLTQCVTSQGKHCAVSSTGKKFCWTPGETGTKVSGNEAATKSPEGATVNPPTTPPKNNGEWQQTGSGTASVSGSGGTTTYNVTNYTSNYGTEGTGGGAEGEGGGEGDGEGDGDVPGEGVGDLYEPTDKTTESVYGAFKDGVQDAPIFAAATGFLGGCSGGGQCPNETWDGGDYAGTFDLSQLCSGPLAALFGYAGWVFLGCMGIVAFRWALL